MVPKFIDIAACFSCSLPDLNSSKLSPIVVKASKIIFPNNTIQKKLRKLQCHCPCRKPQLLILLPEGREGEAWELSKNDALSPLP
jgi:hypothetical protein